MFLLMKKYGVVMKTVNLHTIERDGELYTEKLYKLNHWDPDLNSKLHKEYMVHVDLVMDLSAELTRAANHVCDQVRRYLLSNFRL